MSETTHIEQFLSRSYSDSALMNLLRECETGEISFMNPHHCLLGLSDAGYRFHRRRFNDTPPAEYSFKHLVPYGFLPIGKRYRRRLGQAMIPLIQQEISARAAAFSRWLARFEPVEPDREQITQ